ncbi:MAG: biotin/lipoyl-binding protein [Bacteroidetes bacterium]|uniref:Biotin/lipoyl-binding protein n=1 Tax=Candidatus Egerieousia excrementavium TaxID=2840778 RepID=A0A9D9DL84_9BACT|nr:biotin/lipoyl-binding protein [Candidatus Egerieousia excrementavium]
MKEYKLKINGNDYAVTVKDVDDTVAEVEVNGTPFKVEFEKPITKRPVVVSKPASPKATPAGVPEVKVTKPATGGSGATVTSPLPGIILEISCKEGDTVKKGQKLLVLEAMKMENVIEATADGQVTSIKVNKGDSVLEGAPLVIIG